MADEVASANAMNAPQLESEVLLKFNYPRRRATARKRGT
jgi:hypothetical protein